MEKNLIQEAIEICGVNGFARELGVSGPSLLKWKKQNSLPRTEWTGETNYAAKIEQLTDGRVTRDDLLSSGFGKRS
ncbi:MAG: hypothetical protein WC426_02490 [Sulfuriferula sp.]|jgi:DNA-binding transcriptional regulator YdaS (Cro superfamily)